MYCFFRYTFLQNTQMKGHRDIAIVNNNFKAKKEVDLQNQYL